RLACASCACSGSGRGWFASWMRRMPAVADSYQTGGEVLQDFLNAVENPSMMFSIMTTLP
ncbi:hypothetical protein, partial [Comamonas faecalis]|uniref:hypothetical protein n=1 Tax=Comamonas faecalis TaxID=1387849 RepID=UPI0031F1785A